MTKTDEIFLSFAIAWLLLVVVGIWTHVEERIKKRKKR